MELQRIRIQRLEVDEEIDGLSEPGGVRDGAGPIRGALRPGAIV